MVNVNISCILAVSNVVIFFQKVLFNMHRLLGCCHLFFFCVHVQHYKPFVIVVQTYCMLVAFCHQVSPWMIRLAIQKTVNIILNVITSLHSPLGSQLFPVYFSLCPSNIPYYYVNYWCMLYKLHCVFYFLNYHFFGCRF